MEYAKSQLKDMILKAVPDTMNIADTPEEEIYINAYNDAILDTCHQLNKLFEGK